MGYHIGDEMPGVKRISVRQPEEFDIRFRGDRIGSYFKKHLDEFVFAELSDEYLAKAGITSIMKGIPVPLRKQDLETFSGGSGLKTTAIAGNIARVIGIDPHFKYVSSYVAFLNKIFNGKILDGMLKIGRDAEDRGDFEGACIHFRASLCMDPESLQGMYGYARCCREMYMESDDEETIGRFKAEAFDFFELTTETHPRHAQSYYYLGYMYLNMGLYMKAKLAWTRFLDLSEDPKDRAEITQRLAQLKDPVIIEQAVNDIIAGRYEKGIPVLESYRDTQYGSWWPMHYYLGIAYRHMDRREDAVNSFKKTLEKNGSHIESMRELAEIFRESGATEEEQKYRKKMKIVEKDLSDL